MLLPAEQVYDGLAEIGGSSVLSDTDVLRIKGADDGRKCGGSSGVVLSTGEGDELCIDEEVDGRIGESVDCWNGEHAGACTSKG